MERNKGETIGIMKNNKGITLLALAVTIVVLLILTSIGIKLALGNNGIIGEAKNAKEQAEIDEEKGIVKRATTVSLIKSKGSKVEQDTLEKALSDEAGEGKTEVSDVGDTFEVVFIDSNRYYEVDSDGNISDVNKIIKDEYAGDVTKGGKCDGSEEKPYEISCIEDLLSFSNMVNGSGIKLDNGKATEITQTTNFEGKSVVLKKSLNFKSKYSYDDYSRTDFGNINGDDTDGNMLITEMTTGTGFIPIGQYNSEFRGVFDGNGNSISNIYINSSKESVAVFGCITRDVQIKNLCVQGQIEATNNTRTSGLIGGAHDGNIVIKNCINKIKVNGNGSAQMGGFIANCWGATITMINCANIGDVTSLGKGHIGGFCGTSESDFYIYNCCNIGEIKMASNGNIGGAIGFAWSKKIEIENFYNLGNIGGGGKKSGILANILNATISLKNAYNLGKVDGGAFCGNGATEENLSIENSYYWKDTAEVAVYNKEDSIYGVNKVLNKISNQKLIEFLNDNIKTENANEWKKWQIENDKYILPTM